MLERIGFIGLGVMGRPMARNLLDAGFPVTVHSRSRGPVQELVAAGAADGGSPAGVGAASDVVILLLPDPPDVADAGRRHQVEPLHVRFADELGQ
jgi:3-hydroxyisobutyrate dehydrogenase-like beta-hydroxyacid dehydrogenase